MVIQAGSVAAGLTLDQTFNRGQYRLVRCLRAWLNLLGLTAGTLFVKIPQAAPGQISIPSESGFRIFLSTSWYKSGLYYSVHSLRVSFVTLAVRNGQSHKTIKHQTKQKTDAMIERNTQLNHVASNNTAQNLGL